MFLAWPAPNHDDPAPGLAPGLRPCHESSPPPSPAHAGHWVPGASPALGRSASQRLRRKRLRHSGFAAFWTPLLRGPVYTGDARFNESLNAIAGDQRVASCCRLCQSALLLPGVGLCPVSRRRPSNLLPRSGAPGPPPAGRSSSALESTFQVLVKKAAAAAARCRWIKKSGNEHQCFGIWRFPEVALLTESPQVAMHKSDFLPGRRKVFPVHQWFADEVDCPKCTKNSRNIDRIFVCVLSSVMVHSYSNVFEFL